MLEAGAMPVVMNAITSYAESVKKASALQPSADSGACEAADGPSSSNSEVCSCVPTPSAVLAALSLCQVRLKFCVSMRVCLSDGISASQCISFYIMHISTCRSASGHMYVSLNISLSLCQCRTLCQIGLMGSEHSSHVH